jgi:hypothetical protein
MPDVSVVTNACAFYLAHAAADAPSVRHSLLPSHRGREVHSNTRALRAARSRSCGCRQINVIASAAKQSMRQKESKNGLLRYARNDGSFPSSSPRRRGPIPLGGREYNATVQQGCRHLPGHPPLPQGRHRVCNPTASARRARPAGLAADRPALHWPWRAASVSPGSARSSWLAPDQAVPGFL